MSVSVLFIWPVLYFSVKLKTFSEINEKENNEKSNISEIKEKEEKEKEKEKNKVEKEGKT